MRSKQHIKLELLRQEALEKRARINTLARELIGQESPKGEPSPSSTPGEENVFSGNSSTSKGSSTGTSPAVGMGERASNSSDSPLAQYVRLPVSMIRKHPLIALLAGIAVGAVVDRVVGKAATRGFFQPEQQSVGLKARLSENKQAKRLSRALGKRLTSLGKRLGEPSAAESWKSVFGERAQALALPIVISLAQHAVEGWMNSARRPSPDSSKT